MNEEDQVLAWTINSSAVYNKLLVTSFKYTPVVLEHHIPYKTQSNGKFRPPAQNAKFKALQKLILSYFFIGVVPAALIFLFFLIVGALTLLSFSSYLVKEKLADLQAQGRVYADMAAVDEDLRHGLHAGRAADHLAAFLLIEGDVDLLEGESLVGE